MTLKEWFAIWFDTYKIDLKQHTTRDYKAYINTYLITLLDRDIKSIKAYEIQQALNNITAKRVRCITYQICCNAFKFAYGNNYIDFNIMCGVQNKRGISNKRRALTNNEIQSILKVCHSDSFIMLMMFYLETGVRRSEALSVRIDDVDYEKNRIFILGTKTHNAKRYVPITIKLKSYLQSYKPMSASHLFTYKKAYITRHFKALARKAKIQDICLHCLRHTFITRCRQKKVDPLAVKYWVGHADISTTLNVYTHINDSMLLDNLQQLNA